MSKLTKYSEEEFVVAIQTSRSISQVIEKLGLRKAGGNYKTIRKKITQMGLDISHFVGQSYRGQFAPKKSLESIMVEDSSYASSKLKKRLVSEGIFEHKCYECGLTSWRGKDLVLELEHKNGNHRDHRLENLTLLCPNCHSQTDTWRGRNKRKYYHCTECGTEVGKRASKCKRCCKIGVGRKVERPSKDELAKLLEEKSYCAIGRQFGVSDNAIRKWAKSYELI